MTPQPKVSILLGLSLLAFIMLLSCNSTTDSSRPNIVIVLADDLGYSDIGAYGSEIETPNLDRLAEEGIRFTQMHNTGKCFPSRATLLTGLYAQQVGMHETPGEFHNSVMFGELLKRAGYRTLYVGKHHGTDNPYHWGFDHYRGLRDGAANYFNPGEQRPSDPGPPAQKQSMYPRTFAFDDSLAAPFTPDEDYYGTDTWTDWALELLDTYEDEPSPFLLYLSYQAPHDPLQAPEESIQKYEGFYNTGFEEIARARYERLQEIGLVDHRYPRSEPTYPEWENLSSAEKADQIRRMEVYAGMIDRMDQNIGRVVNRIREMGEWDNTLFIFVSDNGASAEVVEIGDGPIGSITRWSSLEENWANVANTPFRYFKNYSHEGGTATPFIVHWPERITEGGKIDHTPTHFIDLMPTLIEITGASYPEQYKNEQVHPLEGVSLLPLFTGEPIDRTEPLYFDWDRGSAIRTENWKLVRWGPDWELFNMQTDRTETTNVAEDYPEIVERLRNEWQAWANRVGI